MLLIKKKHNLHFDLLQILHLNGISTLYPKLEMATFVIPKC